MPINYKHVIVLPILLSSLSCSGVIEDGAEANTKTIASATEKLHSSDFSLDELERSIDKTVLEVMEKDHLPGVAIVVVKDGHTIFKRGYGIANFETGQKVDPDTTIFRIGSVSKALTALALTNLIDDNRIRLNDDVGKYYKGFEKIMNVGGGGNKVTIQNLLTHTGGFDQVGIGRHVWKLDLPLADRKALRPDVQTFLGNKNLRRRSPPGQYFRYDTYGITLAGAVLANVTGKSYGEAMKAELFNPTGMDNSFVEVPPSGKGNLAIGYGFNDGKYEAMPYELYMTTPASSIDATPADMGRLLEALTGDGANAHGRLFSESTIKSVLAPQFRPHPEFPGVSHGMFESLSYGDEKNHPLRTLGHGGSMLGYHTSFTLFPDQKFGFFIVTNRDPEAGGGPISLHGRVGDTIINIMHQGEQVKPFPIPSSPHHSNLEDYAGSYYYGVFCQTCSEEEYGQGGWRRGSPVKVSIDNGALHIGEHKYFADNAIDIFVRSDGKKRVFFGRDKNGEVSFFNYSSSQDTFERH